MTSKYDTYSYHASRYAAPRSYQASMPPPAEPEPVKSAYVPTPPPPPPATSSMAYAAYPGGADDHRDPYLITDATVADYMDLSSTKVARIVVNDDFCMKAKEESVLREAGAEGRISLGIHGWPTTPEAVDNVPKETFIRKYTNKVIITHKGLGAVSVIAVLFHRPIPTDLDKPAGINGLTTLHAAYHTILGAEYPFREISPKDAFEEMLGKHEWAGLVVGTRPPDGQKPIVHTYIYSTDTSLRCSVANFKNAWDSLLPIILIDSCESKDKCYIEGGNWWCKTKSLYEDFQKYFRLPSEQHQCSLFSKFLWEEYHGGTWDNTATPMTGDNTFKVNRRHKRAAPLDAVYNKTSAPGKLGNYRPETYDSPGFFVVNGCDPCNVKVAALQFQAVGQYGWLFEHAMLYFLCKVIQTGEQKFKTDQVNNWKLCLYAHDGDYDISALPLPTDKVNYGSTPPDYTPLLVRYAHKVKTLCTQLKAMLDICFPSTKKDELDCMTIVKCALNDLKDMIDKIVKCIPADTDIKELCHITRMRAQLMILTARIVDFYTLLQEAGEKLTLPIKSGSLLGDAFCKLTTKVITWYHAMNRVIEAYYNGCRLIFDKKPPCFSTLVVPSPMIVRERLMLELRSRIPEAFDDDSSREPDEDYLLRYVQDNPESAETMVVRDYLSLTTSLLVQRKMAEFDVSQHELCDMEGQIADLMQWASQQNVVGDAARSSMSRWISGVFYEFKETLGQTDGTLVRRILEKRKNNDKRLKDMCKEAINKLRGSLSLVVEILLSLGVNPLADEIIGSRDQEALKGLAALMAIRNDKDGPAALACQKDILCALARQTQCGQLATTNVLAALGVIGNAYKVSPEGVLDRNASFDMVAYPYNQSALLGAMDNRFYTPFYNSKDLSTGYWQL